MTTVPQSPACPRHDNVRLSRFNPLERILVFDDFNTGTRGAMSGTYALKVAIPALHEVLLGQGVYLGERRDSAASTTGAGQ